MNGRERNAKYPVARDVGKPLGGFRRHQGQNRGRHFASDQPINRFRVSLVKLDFNGSSGSYRDPNRRASFGLLVLYRDPLAGKIDTDLISGRAIIRATRSSVLFVGTDAVGSVSLGGRASIRPDASALLASFGAAGGPTCSRHALRERCRGVAFCYWDRRRRPWETKPRSLPTAYRTWQRHYPRVPAVPAMNEARAGCEKS
jgi:hypothetical protein